MRIPKIYGQSRVDSCPFCGARAITKNSQGVPVCVNHKNELLDNMKCSCGKYLDILQGKWGPFFRCMDCGCISFRKGMELNPTIGKTETKVIKKEENKKKEFPKKHNEEKMLTPEDIDLYYS